MSYRISAFLLFLALAPAMGQELPPSGAMAQPEAPVATDAASVAASGPEPEKPGTSATPGKDWQDWRDTTGYPFPPLASVVSAAQNMTQAMNLREYCANSRVSGDFVRERLARFSRITGREEDCRSLLDYFRLDFSRDAARRSRDGTAAPP